MIDLNELERLAKAAPSGPWEVWTSNSWRRIYADQGRDKVRVIEPTIHNHWPDLMFGPGVEAWLENFTPEVALELLAEVRALQEDKERLDSGRIMLNGWDDFGDRYEIDGRGNNLRTMIDRAIEAGKKDQP